MPDDTNIDLPVRVNLQLSVTLNGQEVYGESGQITRGLQANSYATDEEAAPGEIYKLGDELRMRSEDGLTSVVIANG